MMLQIAGVLAPDAVENMRAKLAQDHAGFASGKATAGWYAKDVKHNDQASGAVAGEVMEQVKATLLANAVFLSAARPKTFVKTLVSRYRPGMHYGSHVDSPKGTQKFSEPTRCDQSQVERREARREAG